MKRASFRRTRPRFSVELLEGRLLPANLVALNVALFQVQQNEQSAQADLASELQSFTMIVATAEQTAATKAEPLILDESAARQLAIADANTGNTAAAQQERARAALDLHEYQEDKIDLAQEVALARQVSVALTAQATRDNLDSNRDENALRAGANATAIVAQNSSQTNVVEQNADRIVSQATTHLTAIEGKVDGLDPGGGSPTGPLSGTLLGYLNGVTTGGAGGINSFGVTATNIETNGGVVSGTLTVDGSPNSPATLSGTFNAQGVASGTLVFQNPGGNVTDTWTGSVSSAGITMNLTASDGTDVGSITLEP